MSKSFYDRVRQPIADLNATLTQSRVVADGITRTCQPARRPFVLYSIRGDFLGRFGSLETITVAAKTREAY